MLESGTSRGRDKLEPFCARLLLWISSMYIFCTTNTHILYPDPNPNSIASLAMMGDELGRMSVPLCTSLQ